jgi:hypothetical protein
MFPFKRQGFQANRNAQKVAILQQIFKQRQQYINAYRAQILKRINNQQIYQEPEVVPVVEPVVEQVVEPVVEPVVEETVSEETVAEETDSEEPVLEAVFEEPSVEFVDVYQTSQENQPDEFFHTNNV